MCVEIKGFTVCKFDIQQKTNDTYANQKIISFENKVIKTHVNLLNLHVDSLNSLYPQPNPLLGIQVYIFQFTLSGEVLRFDVSVEMMIMRVSVARAAS